MTLEIPALSDSRLSEQSHTVHLAHPVQRDEIRIQVLSPLRVWVRQISPIGQTDRLSAPTPEALPIECSSHKENSTVCPENRERGLREPTIYKYTLLFRQLQNHPLRHSPRNRSTQSSQRAIPIPTRLMRFACERSYCFCVTAAYESETRTHWPVTEFKETSYFSTPPKLGRLCTVLSRPLS
jgi:hypothetical protein